LSLGGLFVALLVFVVDTGMHGTAGGPVHPGHGRINAPAGACSTGHFPLSRVASLSPSVFIESAQGSQDLNDNGIRDFALEVSNVDVTVNVVEFRECTQDNSFSVVAALDQGDDRISNQDIGDADGESGPDGTAGRGVRLHTGMFLSPVRERFSSDVSRRTCVGVHD